MKKAIIAIAIIGFSLAMSITAWAGTWKQDANGWWYENDDGTYQKAGWFQDPSDSQWYYASDSGYILTNTTTPDGYIVNPDGVWIHDYPSIEYNKTYEAIDSNHSTDIIIFYKTYTESSYEERMYNNVLYSSYFNSDYGNSDFAHFSLDGNKITITKRIKDQSEVSLWGHALNDGSVMGYGSGVVNTDGSITLYYNGPDYYKLSVTYRQRQE